MSCKIVKLIRVLMLTVTCKHIQTNKWRSLSLSLIYVHKKALTKFESHVYVEMRLAHTTFSVDFGEVNPLHVISIGFGTYYRPLHWRVVKRPLSLINMMIIVLRLHNLQYTKLLSNHAGQNSAKDFY